jgi:hypothetical protein
VLDGVTVVVCEGDGIIVTLGGVSLGVTVLVGVGVFV